MSSFDNVRNRLRQGEQARESVMRRLETPPAQQQTPSSRFDAIRNRQEPVYPKVDPNVLPPTIMQSQLMQQVNAQHAAPEPAALQSPAPAKSPGFFGAVKDWLNRFSASTAVGASPDTPMFKSDPNISLKEIFSFPAPEYDYSQPTPKQRAEAERDKYNAGAVGNKTADIAGEVASFFTPTGGGPATSAQGAASAVTQRLANTAAGGRAAQALSRAGAALANKVNPLLSRLGVQASPQLASKAAQAAGTGAVDFGVANTLHKLQTSEGTPQELTQAALEGAAGGAALGAGFSAAASGLARIAEKYAGSKIGDAIGSLLGRNQPTPEQPVLALPPGRLDARLQAAAERSRPGQSVPDIPMSGRQAPPAEQLGLPEPRLAEPTRARIETRPNEYRQKFETLIERANQMQFTPGRELEELESLWSQMAGPRDPNLDGLIDLAYPKAQPSKLSIGSLGRARELQQSRDAAGVPGRVRSLGDRYNQELGEAAAPRQRFETQQPASPEQVLKSSPASQSTGQGVGQSGFKEMGYDDSIKFQKYYNQPSNETVDLLHASIDADGLVKAGKFDSEKLGLGQTKGEKKGTVFLTPDLRSAIGYAQMYEAMKARGATMPDIGLVVVKVRRGSGVAEGSEVRVKPDEVLSISRFEPTKGTQPPVRDMPPPVPQQKELPISQISPFAKGGKYTNPTDTRTYIVTKTEREPFDLNHTVNRFYGKTADNLQAINRLDKQVETVTGKPLSADERAYYHALNSRGSDMIAKHILTERLVDAKGDVIGPALKEITQQIPRRQYTNFNDYLIAKHAETRMARGETVYDKRTEMTPEKLQAKVADYEQHHPEFKQIAEQLYAWNDRLGQAWLVDTGIISPETWAAWREANPYWVPNKRQFSRLEKAGQSLGGKRGFGNQRNPVSSYSAGGSERPIIDPIESLIEYTDSFVKTAKRNEVMQTIVNNLRKDPEALEGFAKLPEETDFAAQKSVKEINEAMQQGGIEGLVDKLNDGFDLTYNKPEKQRIGKTDNMVTALIDGNPTPVEVTDPALLEALINLNPAGRNAAVEAVRAVTNTMKLLTTGVNPIFSLTRNIFRDIPQAYVFSKSTNNPVRFGLDLLDGIVSAFGNKELYQRYKALGGGHSSPVAADRNLLQQSKRELLPQRRQGLGLLPRAYGALENLSNVVESAPRLGEFKRITAKGGDDYASRVKGLYEANDITTNFKRRGSFIREADAFYPYLNAAVQGLDKSIRAVKDNPKALAAKAAMFVTVPTLVLYAINHDNEDYQQLSNYVKDNFFLFPTGNGDFIKIPKSRELGVPFGSMLERIMRAWNDQDPESFKGFAETVRTAFTPPGVSGLVGGKAGIYSPVLDTVAGPLVELAANKNFTGAPIVPQYLEGVSPRYQYDANTSEVSKAIGDILNVSPKQIDHLIRSYTGVVGQLGIPATNEGATIGSTLKKQVTADPVFSTDATQNFYELKDKMDTQYADIKLTGNVPAGYDDGVRKLLDKTASDIGDVSAAIRAIDDMKLTAEEKLAKKRELTMLRNDIARQTYEAITKPR